MRTISHHEMNYKKHSSNQQWTSQHTWKYKKKKKRDERWQCIKYTMFCEYECDLSLCI